VQQATLADGGGHSQFGRDSDVNFSAGVDFSGQRLVIPGPDLFLADPATHAGPVGAEGYSPLFTFGDGVVFNGAEVANRTGVHPKVLSLDSRKRQAVVRLTAGFYLGWDVLYLSTESSVTQIAALENATYAPDLASAPQAGNDDPSLSAREAIIPIVNGPGGVGNPQRQGLQSAVAGEGGAAEHHPRGTRMQRPHRARELLRTRIQPAVGRPPGRLDAGGDQRRAADADHLALSRRIAVQPGAPGERRTGRPGESRPRDRRPARRRSDGELPAHLRGPASLSRKGETTARPGQRLFLQNGPWCLPWGRLNASLGSR
jgi:hypothetical protein